MKKLCHRCGAPNHLRADWCFDCGAFLFLEKCARVELAYALWLAGVGLVLLVASLMLTGCGPAFDANTFSTTGAGGDINTMSEAGAGGRDEGVKNHGDAGKEDAPGGAAGPVEEPELMFREARLLGSYAELAAVFPVRSG